MAIPQLNNHFSEFDRYHKLLLSHSLSKNLSISEVQEHLASVPKNRFASYVYDLHHTNPYIQPRGGYATFQKQADLTRQPDLAGVYFIPLTIDSYTHNNDYKKAQLLPEQSERENRDYLNGYPLINYGHEITRLLLRETEKPFCLRHGTPDARLLAEVALASAYSNILGK
jgi:methylaspartate mutase epsilon subunit